MISFIKKTITGLSKTRNKISNIFAGFSGKSYLEETDLSQLEEALLGADLGWELIDVIIDSLKTPDKKGINLAERFHNTISDYLEGIGKKKKIQKVILLVGVNGTGKTTSAAKLGEYFSQKGEEVSLVAADTYRAGAIEQIEIWSQRLKLNLVANMKSTDPASVAYDGVSSGIAKDYDRIIIDTSGRIHNSPNLMKELEKIYNVIKKLSTEVDVLITIDANTGQNSIQQVREFIKYIPITGVILTKMDGTARGGIAVQIMKELNIPIYFMGVGEEVDDLIPFILEDYINALINTEKRVVNG
tara:strand:+ start:368 stop:1270 length:903 start_codon:yes stop_codon:yes gene_type:complete